MAAMMRFRPSPRLLEPAAAEGCTFVATTMSSLFKNFGSSRPVTRSLASEIQPALPI